MEIEDGVDLSLSDVTIHDCFQCLLLEEADIQVLGDLGYLLGVYTCLLHGC